MINHPENSRAGVLYALERGADWVEVDIRQTQDKKIILFHDTSMSRILKRTGRISNQNWYTLKDLPLYYKGNPTEEKIALAVDAIPLITPKAVALVEIKSGVGIDVLEGFIKELRNKSDISRVCFASRYLKYLKFIKNMNPEIQTVLIASTHLIGLFFHKPATQDLYDYVMLHWQLSFSFVIKRIKKIQKSILLSVVSHRDISEKAEQVGAHGYLKSY